MIKILRTLIKKTKSVATNTSMEQLSIGWYEPLSANKLLSSPLRQQYLKTIWQNVSMEPQMFNVLYKTPIEKYAEIVQLLPASESHHHSHIGGMLDHGLEVISIATKLRQSYILPQNSAPEEQAKQRDVWTAVVIYAALLHDIGKIAVDIEIILQNGARWFPWQGKPAQPYNF
ncbi:TraI domain-containing protein, partial [Glaesserella parasuis]|nr:TraI domain-containing protein [Glaesserella parasuis]